jgi:integrase
VAQVYALADVIGPRYAALILLATFASLRWAELAALTPADIDLDACTVRVTRQINIRVAVATPSGHPSQMPVVGSSRSPT